MNVLKTSFAPTFRSNLDVTIARTLILDVHLVVSVEACGEASPRKKKKKGHSISVRKREMAKSQQSFSTVRLTTPHPHPPPPPTSFLTTLCFFSPSLLLTIFHSPGKV